MSDDPLAKYLGVEPNTAEEQNSSAVFVPSSNNNQIDNDAEYVRQNLYESIEAASRALRELSQIARESQHPRAYEVIATLTKTITDGTDKFMKLHKEKKEVMKNEQSSPAEGDINIEKAVFIGTPNQLIREIHKQQREAIDGEIEEPKE